MRWRRREDAGLRRMNHLRPIVFEINLDHPKHVRDQHPASAHRTRPRDAGVIELRPRTSRIDRDQVKDLCHAAIGGGELPQAVTDHKYDPLSGQIGHQRRDAKRRAVIEWRQLLFATAGGEDITTASFEVIRNQVTFSDARIDLSIEHTHGCDFVGRQSVVEADAAW